MKHIRSYTRLIVSLITVVLVIFALNGANLAYESLQAKEAVQEKKYNETITEEIEIVDSELMLEKQLEEDRNIKSDEWKVEIPKIELIAPISEGTTQEVMMEYVGHFSSTAFWKGNIGLAAHNRRFPYKLF